MPGRLVVLARSEFQTNLSVKHEHARVPIVVLKYELMGRPSTYPLKSRICTILLWGEKCSKCYYTTLQVIVTGCCKNKILCQWRNCGRNSSFLCQCLRSLFNRLALTNSYANKNEDLPLKPLLGALKWIFGITTSASFLKQKIYFQESVNHFA